MNDKKKTVAELKIDDSIYFVRKSEVGFGVDTVKELKRGQIIMYQREVKYETAEKTCFKLEDNYNNYYLNKIDFLKDAIVKLQQRKENCLARINAELLENDRLSIEIADKLVEIEKLSK